MEIANKLIGNPAVLRRIKQVRLLNHLGLADDGISRVQVARQTGLDPKRETGI